MRPTMNKDDLIYIAGHKGMVGSSIVRRLTVNGFRNLAVIDSDKLDLRDYDAVYNYFNEIRPKYIFLAAARVGGIQANIEFPYTFLMDNLLIQNNIIRCSLEFDVERLLFLGSSCIYPRIARQPILETELMTGKLEPTNEGYAIAKIAGLKLIEYINKQFNKKYIAVMPSNVYGENDNFSDNYSHVLAATIRKIHSAKINKLKSIEIWGDGTPKREFIYVDDLADACIFLMDHYFDNEHINIGTGEDISILELNKLVSEIIGYNGKFTFNSLKPNGIPRKLLDISKLKSIGFMLNYSLKSGIEKTYQWYLNYLKDRP